MITVFSSSRFKLPQSLAHCRSRKRQSSLHNDSDIVVKKLENRHTEVCSTILEEGIRKGGPHAPIAQKTAFGWILLSGGCNASALHTRGSFQATAGHELNDFVRCFWEQEAEPSAPAALTPDEQKCEDFYVQTHSRTEMGRDSRFGELYRQFKQEFEDLKHMELATVSPFNEDDYGCFLPHHGVLRESSTSTKLRVVFNGLQQTTSSESLNHYLLVGANLLPALADVLMRWRWHRYAFVTDIEKMYRQILIHPDDRTGDEDAQVELHSFADTSERGYAAAVYLCITRNGTVAIHLLAAKSKVAPVKQVSLPRLELTAADLLTSLTCHTCSTLRLFTALTFLWTDSQVTLHWIRGHASRWKTYVANRVAHIQRKLPDAQWRHVPERDNPADCASRGIALGELMDHPLWWTGPAWLREDRAQWPSESREMSDTELPERKVVAHAATEKIDAEPEMLLRFSSLHRLLRVTAWCSRWRRTASRTTALTLLSEEMDDALLLWLRVVQALHFAAEIT
ncbi:uncharacterized protein [Temnothorax longispinosus]|uniref:uncharacterized protein n=1 Tax=Temnothorax longispinosus TaxID=300112 RepID=UPI003A998D3A